MLGDAFHSIEIAIGWMLAFFYDLIPSFGVSIILLTIAINVVLFPLTLKQTRSTRAFQSIQPEIKRIQKEFKDQPEVMQKELVKVQREAGATPGGCLLPIIVQMPIWWALFRVLRNVADMINAKAGVVPMLPEGSRLLASVQRGEQSFLGLNLGELMSTGIKSGTAHAIPYIIMLAIMVATQYFQQWHATKGQAGAQGELTQQQKQQQQTQQALTKVMPLFLGFVSWNFPAGLVVYWTTSNLFRLGQQFAIFAIDGRPPHPGSNGGGGPDKGGDPGGNGEDAGAKRPHPVSAKKQRRRRK